MRFSEVPLIGKFFGRGEAPASSLPAQPAGTEQVGSVPPTAAPITPEAPSATPTPAATPPKAA